MKVLIVLSCMLATAFAAKLTLHSHLDYQWDEWKNKFGKLYYDENDETVRRNVWEKNMQFVDMHNREARQGKHSFTVGMNQFADMTNEEFVKMFLSTTRTPNAKGCNSSSIYVMDKNYGELPTEVDWRTKGYVTGVKNQGQCGSCWAFSTTGSIEGQHFKATGQLVSLSEQNLMDCSKPEGDFSCEGGLMDYAFDYVIDNGGIDTEASYPYLATDESVCKFSKRNIGATISGCYDVKPTGDEHALEKAVAHIGPVSIAIDASRQSFQLYQSGVYSDPECSSTQLDHGVLAVGYGVEGGKDYWIVKNSWGATWGMQGYIKMERNNNNMCGVATSASYPQV